MKKNYIVKKAFVSYYSIIMLFLLSVMISIVQLQQQSQLLLKKVQKIHLFKIRAYQLIKDHGLEEFNEQFMGEIITSKVNQNNIIVSFLDKEVEVVYDEKQKIIQTVKMK